MQAAQGHHSLSRFSVSRQRRRVDDASTIERTDGRGDENHHRDEEFVFVVAFLFIFLDDRCQSATRSAGTHETERSMTTCRSARSDSDHDDL